MRRMGIIHILHSKILKAKTVPQPPVPIPAEQEPEDPYPNPMNTPPKEQPISAEGLPEAPKSRKAMLRQIYRDYWIGDEQFEMNAMHRKKVWKKGPVIPGRKLLLPKWIYTYKIDKESNTVLKLKTRRIVMGNTQTPEVDYDQSFSPVVRVVTLRMLLDRTQRRFHHRAS
jgi:hypothetical protein